MEWKTIAPLVGAVAPLAGSILGGLIPFPGSSLIGEKFGKIIAAQLGVVPTPEAVNDKLATATEETKRAAINAAVEQARVEIDGFVAYERAVLETQVKNLADVNATIRAEAAGRIQLALQGIHEHWFFTAGRPAALWVFNTVSLCFGLMLTVATAKVAWYALDPLKVLADAWPLFASYFGPLCLVNGIYINARSTEKKAAIENAGNVSATPPSAPLASKATNPPAPPMTPPKFVPKPAGSRD